MCSQLQIVCFNHHHGRPTYVHASLTLAENLSKEMTVGNGLSKKKKQERNLQKLQLWEM